MICFHGSGVSLNVRKQYQTKRADPVSQNGDNDRYKHKKQAAPFTAVHNRCEKAAEHDRGNEKSEPSASLNNLEATLRNLYNQAVGEDRNPDQAQAIRCECGCKSLQTRYQESPERYEKKQKQHRC